MEDTFKVFEPAAVPFGDLMATVYDLGHFDALGMTGMSKDEVRKLDPDSEVSHAVITSYQDVHGLVPDGKLGPRTVFQMKRPRCGRPDFSAARGCQSRWGRKDVTYSHRLQFDGVDSTTVGKAFQRACDQWNEVCGINLQYTTNFNSADIYAQSGIIDTEGQVLAWSYMPDCDQTSGRIEQKYDTRERWNFDFLVAVICHEVGHAIGLDHLGSGNLLAPTYDPRITKPQAGDINQVILRYGRRETPVPTPTPDPTPVPTPGGALTVTAANRNGQVWQGNLPQVA